MKLFVIALIAIFTLPVGKLKSNDDEKGLNLTIEVEKEIVESSFKVKDGIVMVSFSNNNHLSCIVTYSMRFYESELESDIGWEPHPEKTVSLSENESWSKRYTPPGELERYAFDIIENNCGG